MERLSKEEAIQYLTKQRDMAEDCQTKAEFRAMYLESEVKL